MINDINIDLWLSRIGLGLIFIYCLLASIFFSYFAQLHVSLSFLHFPIFIGEIAMFICIPLLVWVVRDGQSFSHRTVFLLGLYFGWVFIKALINYHFDGPLSFRNAALFYYPVFAVFAYAFYPRAKISREVLMFLAFLAAGILFFKIMIVWYWWTYVILLVIAIWNTKSVLWRRIGWVFLALIFLLGKEYLYKGPRAHFVSVFVSGVFLVSYFSAFLVQRRDFLKLGILLASLVLFISGYLIFSNKNDIFSLTSVKGLISSYESFDSRFQKAQASYVPEKLDVQLYHPKEYYSPFTDMTSWKDVLKPHIRQERSRYLDETNIVFRLFVWRDMAQELIEKKAWWGFSFGHPQRSRSLEVLDWAKPEWGRDGWITPHNSFLHVIYRAGILGLGFLIILFWMMVRLIKDFFKMNSVEGGFLVAGLVYWLMLSNFFVILEFPYNAIIFWTLFGITCAYRDALKGAKPLKS